MLETGNPAPAWTETPLESCETLRARYSRRAGPDYQVSLDQHRACGGHKLQSAQASQDTQVKTAGRRPDQHGVDVRMASGP